MKIKVQRGVHESTREVPRIMFPGINQKEEDINDGYLKSIFMIDLIYL